MTRLLLLLTLGLTISAQIIDENVLANFSGKLRTLTHKDLSIETEDGNELVFWVTHGTRFERDGSSAAAKDFHIGEDVTVRAEATLKGGKIAVVVVFEEKKKG